MPIILYGLVLSPPCRAVLLTARAIGVAIQQKPVDLHGKQEHRTETFLRMNPTHTIPTLDDNGFCMWESRAIMSYLVQQYAKGNSLYPEEPKKRALVDTMLYFDADCLYSSIQHYFQPMLHWGRAEDLQARDKVRERLGFLNAILEGKTFAAGDQLTIADYSIISSLTAADAAGFNSGALSNIAKWSTRIKADTPFYDEVTKQGIDKLNEFFAMKMKK